MSRVNEIKEIENRLAERYYRPMGNTEQADLGFLLRYAKAARAVGRYLHAYGDGNDVDNLIDEYMETGHVGGI